MHELSVALSIVRTADAEVKKIGGSTVVEIYLEIGKLSGVELGSLQFVWSSSVQNTVLENAKLTISEPEGMAKCLECGRMFAIAKHYDSCVFCDSPFKSIEAGKELKIKKLIID